MPRRVLLVQLPVPPPGPGKVEGNVPLAAASLKLFTRRQGLERRWTIELLPPGLANTLGDQGLIEEILQRRPGMVGLTCYVWNVERTLWIARRLRERQPELKIVLGGPEITADNGWVLADPAVDYAVLGEGEAAFAELLAQVGPVANLPVKAGTLVQRQVGNLPHGAHSSAGAKQWRASTLTDLDAISSPYIEGILDLGDGRSMLLETVRGCRYRCKYCYYPKGDHRLRMLSSEQVLANLEHAVRQGAKEVVLLDPTLNQRPDFAGFLRLLDRGNEGGQLKFSGELRAEGIGREEARLLRQAGFHDVEVGLQSVEPKTWELMGRPTDLERFRRGVRAMLDEGIRVCVDLMLGLPGETADSARRAVDFLLDGHLYSTVQVFNVSILPGTAFRRQAKRLGLRYQPWPPYYVVETPTLTTADLCRLLEEAEEALGVEFDRLPPPRLDFSAADPGPSAVRLIELNAGEGSGARGRGDEGRTERGDGRVCPAGWPALCFTLWFRSADFRRQASKAAEHIGQTLAENPYTTLQVVLEPLGNPQRLTARTLELLLAKCYENPTYLDRFYSLHPGKLLGSKRLVVLAPNAPRGEAFDRWRREISEMAVVVERDEYTVRG